VTASGASPSKWAVYVVVAIGVLMATIDSSIVNISLPSIGASFGRPLGGVLSWVVIAYLVVIVALLLSGGRLGDLLGRKRVWQAGLGVFTVSSALCGLAPTLGALIACRALQGIGAALLMSTSPVLLTSAFPPQERGRALGMNAFTVAVGVSLGPPLGGFITEHGSWRWIFFINVPLGTLGLLLAGLILPRAERRPSRFDLGGAIGIGLALSCFTAALSFVHQLGWGSPLIWSGFLLSALAVRWFCGHEARHPAPLLDLGLFRDRLFASALTSLVLSFLAMFSVVYLTPFYLEQVRGLSVAQSGQLMMAYPLAIALVAPLAGRLSDRIGSGVLAPLGALLSASSLYLLGSVGVSTPLPLVGACLASCGLSQALFHPANNSALLGAVPRERQGVAGGLLATGRTLGQCLSAALMGAVFAGLGGAEAGRRLAAPGAAALDPAQAQHWVEVFLRSYRAALWLAGSLALLAAAVAYTRRRVAAPASA
jgi:EmrB/QacA subfamily drug resistance transporter